MPRTLSIALALLGGLVAIAQPATAQEWPTRSVRFILPIGPGAGVDITARLLADKLSARWNQPVVVENRPGGDAILAITSVLGAKDDHVLLFAPASAFTAHPLLHDKLPYNPDDLEPIARVTNTIIGIAVPSTLDVSTLKQFVDKVRAEPGKMNFASATGANDLLFAAFLKGEKLEMAKVPYKNTVEAANDLAEGRVQGYVGAYAILRPRIQAGKIKLLALTNPKPAPMLPDVPTATQAGFPAFTIDGLTGLFSARGMPLAVRERIAKDIREVVADKAVAERLSATGQVVNPGTPAEFAAAIEEQRATVKRIGEVLELKPTQ